MSDARSLLLAIAVIVVATRLGGLAAERIRQPRVMGEILAGLILGPSLLGRFAPDAFAFLFPAPAVSALQPLSQLGLILFLFLLGLELDLGHLRALGPLAVVTSQVSILVPLLLGTAVGLGLPDALHPAAAPWLASALFVGVALSVTAFPVLARILVETGLARTPLGAVALACAAVDDVTAWCLLAALSAYVRSGSEAAVLVRTAALLATYVAVMFLLVRPALRRLLDRLSTATDGGWLAAGVALMLLSASATEWIGVHGLFGAFLAGVVMPREPALRTLFTSRLEGVTVAVLLPLFFALTGLRTDVTLLASGAAWATFAVILVAAVAGKLGGSALAARAMGMAPRNALVLGLLLNARGLVELVVLGAGLDLGVLSPALYSMMVLMAVATTFMTTPLVSWLHPETEDAAERPRG